MPTAFECQQIVAAVKQCGGSATTREIADKTSFDIERTMRYIRAMRKFGTLQIKCAIKDRSGMVYELKQKARA